MSYTWAVNDWSDEQIIDTLDGMFAHDTGSLSDNGIRADFIKEELREWLADKTSCERINQVLKKLAQQYLNSIVSNYTLKDIAKLLGWLKDEMGYEP